MVALRYPLLAVAVEADAASPFVNVYDLERRRIVRWIDRWQQGQVTRTNGLIYDVQGRCSAMSCREFCVCCSILRKLYLAAVECACLRLEVG